LNEDQKILLGSYHLLSVDFEKNYLVNLVNTPFEISVRRNVEQKRKRPKKFDIPATFYTPVIEYHINLKFILN